MKTAAVICEYNPFHNGHAYQLQQMRKLTKADFVIAFMSGNFVQRGEPACFDKYARAEMALFCGADLVLELPPVFAVSSAREFASAGVMTCIKSGIVDVLCFGTEGKVSLSELSSYARMLDSAGGCDAALREALKNGMTYPEAMATALRSCTADSSSFASASFLSLPNNILAVEYLRALQCFADAKRPIEALAIERIGAGYHDADASDSFASATGIRSILEAAARGRSDRAALLEALSGLVPSEILTIYERCLLFDSFARPADLGPLLSAKLLEFCRMPDAAERLADYLDVSTEIANRLVNHSGNILSFEDRIRDTKTRQYTYSRISRALLHIVLGIRSDICEQQKADGYVPYLNVLGFRREAAAAGLLKELKIRASVPVITKVADYPDLMADAVYYDQLYYALHNAAGAYTRSPVVL